MVPPGHIIHTVRGRGERVDEGADAAADAPPDDEEGGDELLHLQTEIEEVALALEKGGSIYIYIYIYI